MQRYPVHSGGVFNTCQLSFELNVSVMTISTVCSMMTSHGNCLYEFTIQLSRAAQEQCYCLPGQLGGQRLEEQRYSLLTFEALTGIHSMYLLTYRSRYKL